MYSDEQILADKRYFNALSCLLDDGQARQLARHLDIINTKSCTLMTHISIMAASSTVLMTADAYKAFHIPATISFCLYLVLGAVSLYVNLITTRESFGYGTDPGADPNAAEVMRRVIQIVHNRSLVHNRVTQATFALTGLLVLAVGCIAALFR